MLKNDPPPGTRVRFTQEFRESKGYSVGVLVGALRKYYTDNSDDQFTVEIGGQRLTVQRREIEEV
jgi:hypothetical protein